MCKVETIIYFCVALLSTEHCLRFYDVGHIGNNYLVSEIGNPLPPLHRLLFPNSSKASVIHIR